MTAKKAPPDAGPKSREETPTRSESKIPQNGSPDGGKYTTSGQNFDMQTAE
jgi:hypothetical protein